MSLTLALLTGCAAQVPTLPPTEPTWNDLPDAAVQVPAREVTTIFNELVSGIHDRTRVAFDSDDQWEHFGREVAWPASLPIINFEEESVLVVAMGGQVTGGYSISVDGVFVFGNDMYVLVRSTVPVGCVVTQMQTSPGLALRVPKARGKVVFIEEQVGHYCTTG